jgi:hypothetical protein
MPWNGRISDKRVIGAASGISRRRTLNDFFHNVNAGKFISPEDFSPITQQLFCSHGSNKTIKSELCNAYNSFFLEQVVAGVSREESRSSVKETRCEKSYLEQGIKIFKEA